jgi:hypothetical protein
MNEFWERTVEHVFTPFRHYLNETYQDLLRKHHELTGAPFTGWFHKSLVDQGLELKRDLKQLDLDIAMCRQGMALVFINTKKDVTPPQRLPDERLVHYQVRYEKEVEEAVVQRLPRRLLSQFDAQEYPANQAAQTFPMNQQLTDDVMDRFDRYLGAKIVLTS